MRQASGIYMISVVAETLDMHPQTLRKYERAGFIEPLRMGTLRTYSDEDIARLRLIKHFVENLGLNLSGVDLALKLTSQLLDLRRQISAQGNRAEATRESIERIDSMLEAMGVRVVRQPKTEQSPEIPPSGEGWFNVNPGETIEFDQVVQESDKQ